MSDRLPDREAIIAFVREARGEAGLREIARAFRIKGADRRALRVMIDELADEGVLERPNRRSIRTPGSLPPVAVIEVSGLSSDGEPLATPQNWDGEGEPPVIVLAPARKGERPPGRGDRVLARLRALQPGEGADYEAKPIKVLGRSRRVLGVFRMGREGGRVLPVEKGSDREYRVAERERAGAEDGELVEVEALRGDRMGLQPARVIERLGDVGAPRSISLIAIHEQGIPTEFADEALAEAERAKGVRSLKGREDLRDLPLVTIDPADARDHDDAVCAFPDDDPANEGGHVLWVAIADVAHYVRPGTALDREAVRRGNSCYFPDRVVPMLPDRLSGDLCSLHEGVQRPCMALRIQLAADGRKLGHRFVRGIMRSLASLTYEDAQAMADGAEGALRESVIAPLWACYRALEKARARRQPLELDLPERRIVLSDEGEVESVRFRERLDAHRLIEECMVLANVCAAETLEAKRTPLVYRVHEPPDPERIESLRETLDSVGIAFPKGQRVTPAMLNRALAQAAGTDFSETVSMTVLRAQSQAVYSPDNLGHFGLNLARYAHFTSPIRRYADLIVHRALIRALGLGAEPGKDGLRDDEAAALEETAEHISMTERRAMVAERDSNDRYLAAFMAEREGAEFDGIVSGVARFGMFVKLDETGADGLVPMSALGREYFRHDEERRTLRGERSGLMFRLGTKVRVRLEEAAPLQGGLRFTLVEGGEEGRPMQGGRGRKPSPKRGRRPTRSRRR